MLKVAPKGPQSDPKRTPMFYKIIKIYWKNECFLKIYPHTPKVIPQWFQSDHKVTQKHSNVPKVAPKCLQNASKAAPKAPSYAKNDPKAAPNATQSHLAYQNEPQRDSKVTPKSPSYAQNVLQVLPKSPSYAKGNPKLTPKSHRDALEATLICQKWSQSDSKATPELYKTIKIYWENECFLKVDLYTPKVTPLWFHSAREVTQKHSNIPKETPKWIQSDPKVTPKDPQRHPHMPNMAPKLPQSHHRMPKITTKWH